MIDSVIIDASVFMASTRRQERGHLHARAFLSRCIEDGVELIEPAHLIAELLGALVRTGSSTVQARRLLALYRLDGRMNLQPVTEELGDAAGAVASMQKIKGCDAIYLALARAMAVPLITLDREQQERAPADVEVLIPAQALARWWSS